MSVLTWLAALRVVPALGANLAHQTLPLADIVPALWRPLSFPRHLKAYALTVLTMLSHMFVIPFMSPVLAANGLQKSFIHKTLKQLNIRWRQGVALGTRINHI